MQYDCMLLQWPASRMALAIGQESFLGLSLPQLLCQLLGYACVHPENPLGALI